MAVLPRNFDSMRETQALYGMPLFSLSWQAFDLCHEDQVCLRAIGDL